MTYRILPWMVLAFLTARSPVLAHALGAECKLRDGRIELEAYYDDDSQAVAARVTVLDAEKQTIAEGRTDRAGRWSFPAPPLGTYQVVIDAGKGHRAVIKMSVPSAGEALVTEQQAEPKSPATSKRETVVSEGPRREEFTRIPWLRVAIGLAVIASLALAWRLIRKTRPVRSV